MLFRTPLKLEWYILPTLKEITVEPPEPTTSIDRQKQFVPNMFTQGARCRMARLHVNM